MNYINECSHIIPTKSLGHTHQGIKNIFNMSPILTQKKTNTKNQKFQSLPNNFTNVTTQTHYNKKSKYKHTWKSTKYLLHKYSVPGNNKVMLIANTLKVKLNSQHKKNE